MALVVGSGSMGAPFAAPAARAEPGLSQTPEACDPTSVFIVAKNQNRNQVHYGVHLDAACNAIGAHPVYGYWRMLERQGEVEPILPREIPAYGVNPSQRIERSGETTTIHTRLNAAPDRPLVITVKRAAGRCKTEARTSIAGADARLRWAYVRFGFLGVDYILLHGFRTSDGTTVEERL
jgi:hypothetical protein